MSIMIIYAYYLPILLFIISIIGIVINNSNIILILICIEILLLSISLCFLSHSFVINNSFGQICSIYVITVAAVESAIGLSIIISFYNLNGSISISFLNLLNG